jgi:hypothetical protein
MANIDGFKANLIGGGARANQFQVELAFPAFLQSNAAIAAYKGQFLCKAAQLPASTVDKTPVNYRGREVKFAGERVFAPWRVTILNDTDFLLRNLFEAWMNGINNHRTNQGITNASQYQTTFNVFQLDRNGGAIKGYSFVDAFPVEVSAIELSFDNNNEIETFDVTFEYNYWTSRTSTESGTVYGGTAAAAAALIGVLR